jgi:hypothetical protein
MTSVVVLGSGSLARSLCYSMAVLAESPVRVSVVARRAEMTEEICHVSRVRAAMSGSPVEFHALSTDLRDQARTATVLAEADPQVVVSCVSTQSPWEAKTAPSAWTRLLESAGFGLTVLLHSELAVVIGRALREASSSALFFNASFPDAVNPLLRELEIPVTAGIGNVAILAAALQTALGLSDQAQLHLLAHHLHLRQPATDNEALGWLDESAIDVGVHLRTHRGIDRREANQITGHGAASLLCAVVRGDTVATHLPGPGGLPGGYPVSVSLDGVRLRLPSVITADEAIRANMRWAELDGATVQTGQITFSERVIQSVRTALADFPEQIVVSDIAPLVKDMDALRKRLRRASP